MAKKEKAAPPADGAAPAPGKGKLKLIILIVVGLLIAIGGSVGATWFFLHKSAPPAAEAGKEGEHAAGEEGKGPDGKPLKKEAVYEVLAPAFIVNFNVNGRQRYMQVSVALMARDQAKMDALKAHMPVLRNNLVLLFSGQNFDNLATPVGKEMLRQLATASVQELAKKEVGDTTVEQVLFTNIVLQ